MTNAEAVSLLMNISAYDIDNKRGMQKQEALEMGIKALEQTRPKGTWIFKNDNIAIPTGYYQCSECKEGKLLVKDNFCPNCGADMRESGANVDE